MSEMRWLLGCQPFTLQTIYGWLEFSARHGRINGLHDRYFGSGFESV